MAQRWLSWLDNRFNITLKVYFWFGSVYFSIIYCEITWGACGHPTKWANRFKVKTFYYPIKKHLIFFFLKTSFASLSLSLFPLLLRLHLAIEQVMYQSSSSTSSSSQRSSLPGGGGGGAGLIRYGSAPGSLLNSMVDEVIGGSNARDFNYPPPDNFLGDFFAGADSSSLRSESMTCGVNSSDGQKHLGSNNNNNNNNKDLLMDRSYGGFNEISQHKINNHVGGGSSSGSYSLARQRSSPADFFSYLSGEKNSEFTIFILFRKKIFDWYNIKDS